MKLKLKVKTLIGVIIIVLFTVFIAAPTLNLGIGRYLSEKGSDKSEVFFKNYMASPIKISEKQGLYQYGMSLVKGFERFTIKFNGRGGGENTTPENMEKAMELFETVLLKDEKNNYKDYYAIESYSKLLDSSIALLDMERLIYWIDWGKDKDNEDISYMSTLYEAYYYFAEKDYHRAKEILEELNEDKLDRKYYHLMGDISLHLGDVQKAEEYYEYQVDMNLSSRGTYFGGRDLYFGQEEIKSYIDKSQGEYKIKGKVSYNGKGLPFVEVYLSEELWALRVPEGKPDAITDRNGEFEILGAKQGVYELGIGIHPSQLYNRVFLEKNITSIELNSDMEFDFDFASPMEINDPKEKIFVKEGEDFGMSWDEVKGADYYQALLLVFTNPKESTGSLFKSPLEDKNGNEKLKDNNGTFNMKNPEKNISVLIYEEEDSVTYSTGIFGGFITNIEYPLIVNAYNEQGDLIGSSLPLISDYDDMISLEIEGELTKGENLILDKKYEEAISYYEGKLIENPKDKEALFYLTRFYTIGWEPGENDIRKALKYAEEYDNEYKDYSLSLEVISFFNINQIRENRKLVGEVLEDVAEKHRDTNYYRELATYYVIGEDYKKARDSYDKMTDYKYVDIIYIDMYLGDYEKAIEELESGELTLIRMNSRNVIDGLKNMDKLTEKDKDLFKNLLKNKLVKKISRDEQKTLYKETLNSVSSLELKNIIREIGKEENWER